MARRRGGNDLVRLIRNTRHLMYNGARHLGDAQSLVTGDPHKILRRGARKLAGRAWSHFAFGGRKKGNWLGMLLDIGMMLFGRGIGGRGRW